MINNTSFSSEEYQNQLILLKTRFEKHMNRHENISWDKLQEKLQNNTEKISSLIKMELSGGEPDVVAYDEKTDEYIFYDCSKESPIGRRSFCYDYDALSARKQHKPENNAIDVATTIGIEILTQKQYEYLQELGEFDLKTSSWIQTPDDIRTLGGALFCDRRYDHIFVYHNSADSYYSSRGFRGSLRV